MILYRCVQQINEIRKLTHSQRDLLNNLRINFDKPAQMKLYLKQLEHVDLLLQRVILIGVLLQLKNLVEEALQDVLFMDSGGGINQIRTFLCAIQNNDIFQRSTTSFTHQRNDLVHRNINHDRFDLMSSVNQSKELVKQQYK